ncbi:MAG: hypothetical protein IK008_01760 [Bacteroidales bacterium]|nr:hypothetical protein [Bacteroidales bacterium]
MKKINLIWAILLASVTVGNAQSYTPTTTWPYYLQEFQQGVLKTSPTDPEKEGLYNISYKDKRLHYIDGEYIRSVLLKDMAFVQIGNEIYQSVNGFMVKVLAKSEKCLVIEDSDIDYVALNNTGGAYGSSSTTIGTMALSSAEGIGATNASTNITHMELKLAKDNGKLLPLIVKKYIVVKGRRIYATKRDFLDTPGLDRSKAKAFLKENKIKWNNVQNLLLVGDFLADELQ